MLAFAAAIRRSAAEMSGLRSSNSEGKPDGIKGGAVESAFRNSKGRGGLPSQQRQGMLKLRPLEHHGGQLRLGCLKHRLRLGNVEIGHRSPGPQVAGQLQRFGEDLDAGVEDRASARPALAT